MRDPLHYSLPLDLRFRLWVHVKIHGTQSYNANDKNHEFAVRFLHTTAPYTSCVTRSTSSSVVTPFNTFSRPSSRKVFMP